MVQRMLITIVALGILMCASAAVAGVPQAISYQGLLLNSGGQVAPGNYDLVFKIYDAAAGGTELWSETHIGVMVDQRGTFNAKLGVTNALDQSVLSGESRWVEISVSGEVVTPRTELLSSAYSFRVATVDKAEAGALKGSLVLQPSAARAAAELIIVGSLADTVILSPGGGTILRATNQGGVEVFNASMSSIDNSAMIVITGPGGDDAAQYGSGGIELSSNAALSRALQKRMLIHPEIGIGLLSRANPDDTIAFIREATDGEPELRLENHSAARLYKGSISLYAPGGTACNIMSAQDELGDYLMKTCTDATLGTHTDYYMPAAARATQQTVRVGAEGLKVYSSTSPGDLLVSIDQSAIGDAGAVSVYSSSAKSGRASTLISRINAEGVSVYDATGTNRVAVFDQGGNVQFSGIAAGGQANLNKSSRVLAPWSTVFGFNNFANGDTSTVSGGYGNVADGRLSAISGGAYNHVVGVSSVIGGGYNNQADGTENTIAGGINCWTDSSGATVGGGLNDTARGYCATVSGGLGNRAWRYAATVGGGGDNIADGFGATVGGGFANVVDNSYGTVAGGNSNQAGVQAAIGGGGNNLASGARSIVPGGKWNSAVGDNSVAIGFNAKANHFASMVVSVRQSSNQSDSVMSSGPGQIVMQAQQGFYLTNALGMAATMDGTKLIQTSTGAYLTNTGTWTNSSDKNLKENFETINGSDILKKLDEMDITRWNYKKDESGITHIGPMAQDFYAAFGLGHDDVTIATVDADGVALAAIKALYEKIQILEKENGSLKNTNAELGSRLDRIEKTLAKLASGGNTDLALNK